MWLLYTFIHFELAALALHVQHVLTGMYGGTAYHTACRVTQVLPKAHAHYTHGAPIFRLNCTAYLGK